jgi:class 3 adenylate cyclase/tetratricopeptide (TPR) repeat protein
MQCPRCRHEAGPAARFCEACGAALTGTLTVPPTSYTPKHLAEKILTSRAAIEGERKQVTVLFCDLAESTALAERVGPEAMHGLLNHFFELALKELHRYEGTMNQFLGDGFMALFGAPVAHEDHARRAVLAAVGMRRTLREQRGAFALPPGVELRVRMGLNTGLVVVGTIGDDLRMDYTAVGETTNLAARLQQLAAPDAIYLSETTHHLVERYVQCEALGEWKVKGKTEPVGVHRLMAVRTRAGDGSPDVRPLGSPLVGREKEVAALRGCLERLGEGHGAIVTIRGEAGLGKSRLVTEAIRTYVDVRPLWLEGRALSFGQNLSYWPFLEILRRWTGITEDDGEADSRSKLDRRVRGLFGDKVADVLPYLFTLLGLRVPAEFEHRVKYLDGQSMGRQIFRSVRRLFERLASERPVVLLFEDLHWADQSSLELLEHLLPLVETAPLMVCVVARADRGNPADRLCELARANHAERCTEITLMPLPPAASAALVDNLVGRSVIPAGLKDLILSKAEGNPFFVEEVVRSLASSRVLVWDAGAGHWRVSREVDRVTVPDTLQGVIMARVDRLSEDVKEVLKVASVIGRSFLYPVLEAVTDAGRQLDAHLNELEAFELIREKRRLPELEFIFKHAIVQEATYESILSERRRLLHRQVGECIERMFGARLEEFYGVLAYHYARAEDWEKAQAYLFKAGDHAGRVAADTEALTHYRDAIGAYERAFGDRWEPLQRATLERKIGEALFCRGDHEHALEYLSRALATLGVRYPTSRWGIRLAIGLEIAKQLGHRMLPGLFVRSAATTVHPVAEEILRLSNLAGWIDYFTDQERFVLRALRGLNLFERYGHSAGVVFEYMCIGVSCDAIPAPALAGRYHRRAVKLAEATGHPIALGHAHLGLGLHAEAGGRFDEALEHLRRSAGAFREAGHLRGWGAATSRIVYVFHSVGDFITARDRADDLFRVGEEASDRELSAWGLMLGAMLKRCTGPLEAGIQDLRAAIAVFERIPDYSSLVQASGLLGACLLRNGEVGEALVVLERARGIIVERRLRGITVAGAPVVLAEAYVAAHDQAIGTQRAEMLGKARRAARDALKQGAMFRYWWPMAYRIQGMVEWRRDNAAGADRCWRRSLAVAEEIRAPYERARTFLEIGRHAGDRAAIDRAAAAFEELGAAVELAEVGRPIATSLQRAR